MFPFLRGFGLGASLIVAIGAQTAGVGGVVTALPWLVRLASVCGAAFLLFYGGMAFRRALHPAALEAAASAPATRGGIVLATLSVSLLNPHVYLDTVILVGGLSAQYAAHSRLFFALGAISASFLWFFSLALGAAFLAPLFRRPRAWRVLDCGVGVVMWAIAVSLLRGLK